MLFPTLTFAVFCGVFFPLHFFSSGRLRLAFTLIASYVFYGWWDWRFLSLIALSTLINYGVGLALSKPGFNEHRRSLLAAGIAGNLSILGLFKYFDFFAISLSRLLNGLGIAIDIGSLNFVLPIGISFYTFQGMSYVIDVFRRKCATETSLLRLATYIALFPQLVAGPIVRATHLLPQLRRDHGWDWGRVGRGIELIAWGLFLKLCLADALAPVVDLTFGQPAAFGGGAHLIGVVFFTFQIYGDFAGYSLIAIGLGRVMGLDFGINFATPYFSRSFSEFWERWHISLSSWLRDYLYIPLGGNQHGAVRTARNLVIVMFLGGLWHGAAWHFVLWGLLHGVYLVAQRAVGAAWRATPLASAVPRLLQSALQMAIVFTLTCLAWVIFRADSFPDAVYILDRITTPADYLRRATDNAFSLVKGTMLIVTVVVIDALGRWPLLRSWYLNHVGARALALLLLLWSIAFFGVFEGKAFIYFQF